VRAIVNDLSDKKFLVFETVTNTNMKQLEIAMETQ
jgi:hypothetical protein